MPCSLLLIPGGLGREMVVRQVSQLPRSIRPDSVVGTERKRIAHELLGEVRRLERELKTFKTGLRVAVDAADTTLTGIYGAGPVAAWLPIGSSGDIGRFPTRHHYAAYNGTTPVEASSGERKRHWLNPRGNRVLNHALQVITVTQLRCPVIEGRLFYEPKLAEGKMQKERSDR